MIDKILVFIRETHFPIAPILFGIIFSMTLVTFSYFLKEALSNLLDRTGLYDDVSNEIVGSIFVSTISTIVNLIFVTEIRKFIYKSNIPIIRNIYIDVLGILFGSGIVMLILLAVSRK